MILPGKGLRISCLIWAKLLEKVGNLIEKTIMDLIIKITVGGRLYQNRP